MFDPPHFQSSFSSSFQNKDQFLPSHKSVNSTAVSKYDTQSIFSVYNRLGHPAVHTIKSIMKACNLPNVNEIQLVFCIACYLGKIHKYTFPSSHTEYTTPFELIYTDLWGP